MAKNHITTTNTMPVDTTLTPAMLARLARIDEKYLEDKVEGSDEKDPTRLCKSWLGALPEDKAELEKMVVDPDLAGKMSAGKIKEEYPKYRIYTTACVQNAIGNYRKKCNDAVKKREESKHLCLASVS